MKLRGTVEETLEKVKIGTIMEGRKGWWDGDCRERKESERKRGTVKTEEQRVKGGKV